MASGQNASAKIRILSYGADGVTTREPLISGSTVTALSAERVVILEKAQIAIGLEDFPGGSMLRLGYHEGQQENLY